jgi:hypothetical protein
MLEIKFHTHTKLQKVLQFCTCQYLVHLQEVDEKNKDPNWMAATISRI